MILLFGSTGYIGTEFKKQLELKKIPFTCCPPAKNTTFDDLYSMYQFMDYPLVDAVINAAGYTGKPNVDACENNKEETLNGNVLWTQILTDFCMFNKIPLLHVSSGCIYEGNKDGKGFTEEHAPNLRFDLNNCSFYSGTKVIAEKIVSTFEKSWICRLRIPFEQFNNKRNYISKLINYDKLLDVENSLSNKHEFVSACISIILNQVDYGIYNVTNTGSIQTRFVTDLLEKYNIVDKKFDFFKTEEDFYNSGLVIAKRSNCVLDNTKLLNTGIKMTHIEESIENCIKNFVK